MHPLVKGLVSSSFTTIAGTVCWLFTDERRNKVRTHPDPDTHQFWRGPIVQQTMHIEGLSRASISSLRMHQPIRKALMGCSCMLPRQSL